MHVATEIARHKDELEQEPNSPERTKAAEHIIRELVAEVHSASSTTGEVPYEVWKLVEPVITDDYEETLRQNLTIKHKKGGDGDKSESEGEGLGRGTQ